MLILVFRGIFLIGILSWYSTNVWKMIDGYFKDSFEKYLQREYQKNPKMRDDVSAYGLSGDNDKAGKTFAGDNVPKSENARRNCETLSALGEETCPIDYASMEALAGGQAGSGSLSAAALSAGYMTDGGHASKSEVSEKGAADLLRKNAHPEGSSSGSRAAAAAAGATSLDVDKLPRVDDKKNEEPDSATNINSNRDKMKMRQKTATSRITNSDVETSNVDKIEAKKPSRKNTLRRSSRDHQQKQETTEERTKKSRKKQKVKTIILTDEDFKQAKIRAGLLHQDYDFSEFDDDDDDDYENNEAPPEGVLVSQLPFKPRADIGNLERVTDEEFCPLTLEDGVNCGETRTWP